MKAPEALCALTLCASAQLAAQAPAPVPHDPALQHQLITQVDLFMHAWQQRDAAALTRLMAPEFVYVSSRGVTPREDVVGALTHGCTLTSYTLSDVQLIPITEGAAALAYKIHQSASCDGHPDPPVVLNTDTFVRRGGRWVFSMTTSTTAD